MIEFFDRYMVQSERRTAGILITAFSNIYRVDIMNYY